MWKDVNRLFYEVKPKDINQVDQFNAQTVPWTLTCIKYGLLN
jgi:hypothetical protein